MSTTAMKGNKVHPIFLTKGKKDINFSVCLVPDTYKVIRRDHVYLVRWQRVYYIGKSENFPIEYLEKLSKDFASIENLEERDKKLVSSLLDKGLLILKVSFQNKDIMTIVPRRLPERFPDRGEVSQISQFAVCTFEEGASLIDLPHSWCDLRGVDLSVLVDFKGMPKFLRQLGIWAGLYDSVIEDFEENISKLENEMWSPHELWFHEKTRRFARTRKFGGTFWAKDKYPAPDHNKNISLESSTKITGNIDETIELKRQPGYLFREKSRRKFSEQSVSKNDLFKLLQIVFRDLRGYKSEGFEYISKEYPSGGSAYELQPYVLVDRVDDIEPGLWWYDSRDHTLNEICINSKNSFSAIRNQLKFSVGADNGFAFAIILTADFSRIMWKYEEMGYAVILKNLGSAMASLYTASSFLGLGCCAVGSGDSDLFTEVLGVNPMKEASIGEMIFGV